MKTLNWTGFMNAPRREPRNKHWLKRVLWVLVRGAVPVDGFWGNFR